MEDGIDSDPDLDALAPHGPHDDSEPVRLAIPHHGGHVRGILVYPGLVAVFVSGVCYIVDLLDGARWCRWSPEVVVEPDGAGGARVHVICRDFPRLASL